MTRRFKSTGVEFRSDLSENTGPTRLWRDRKSGKRFLAAEEPNGSDVICAELNKNDKAINARNRVPKEVFNKMLDDLEMVADYNTVGFTFSGGKFVKRDRPERL